MSDVRDCVHVPLQHEDRDCTETEGLNTLLRPLIRDHRSHGVKIRTSVWVVVEALSCSLAEKEMRKESLAQPPGDSCRSSLELTQPEMLLAAISQNVNELGFICSPFQFPCLIQVLEGKKWDLIKRRNLRKQLTSQATQNHCQILEQASKCIHILASFLSFWGNSYSTFRAQIKHPICFQSTS